MSPPIDSIEFLAEAQRLASLNPSDEALDILHKVSTLVSDKLDAIVTVAQNQTHLVEYGEAIETSRNAEGLATDDERVANSLANLLPDVEESKETQQRDNEFTKCLEGARRKQRDKRLIDLNRVLK